MIKRSILLLCIFLSPMVQAQNTGEVDSIAVRLLDKMTGVIGELNSLSVDVRTENDFENDVFENERHFGSHTMKFSGPSKMTIYSRGDKGNRAIWYNGEDLTYYSFDENNYVRFEVPDTTIKMVDSVNATFGIKFPAIDMFYPDLTDDILDYFDHVKFLGVKTVENVECFHVMAYNKKTSLQIWITNDAMYLPHKYLFIEKDNNFKQHEGTFTNWSFNPFVPDEVFEFTPPKNAKLISIMSKS